MQKNVINIVFVLQIIKTKKILIQYYQLFMTFKSESESTTGVNI